MPTGGHTVTNIAIYYAGKNQQVILFPNAYREFIKHVRRSDYERIDERDRIAGMIAASRLAGHDIDRRIPELFKRGKLEFYRWPSSVRPAAHTWAGFQSGESPLYTDKTYARHQAATRRVRTKASRQGSGKAGASADGPRVAQASIPPQTEAVRVEGFSTTGGATPQRP